MRTVRILACVNRGVPIRGKVFNQEDSHIGSFPTGKIHIISKSHEMYEMVFRRWEPSLFPVFTRHFLFHKFCSMLQEVPAEEEEEAMTTKIATWQ